MLLKFRIQFLKNYIYIFFFFVAQAKNLSNLWTILTGCQKTECQTIYIFKKNNNKFLNEFRKILKSD